MLLTVATTHRPATDLGYLLHKHPGRHHVADLPFGTAHVFYPEASEQRCEAAVLVEIDPVRLVTGQGRQPGAMSSAAASRFALGQYVNDRPYAASSFMSVALGRLFGTALAGRSKERPDLAGRAIPVEMWLPAVPCRGGPDGRGGPGGPGGADLVGLLFRPLGYDVDASPVALDAAHPGWGASEYCSVRLAGEVRIQDALGHLYVLLPVLDDAKHYWVGPAEVDKLLRRGAGWLAGHPQRDLILRRYLRRDQRLSRDALAALFADEGADPDEEDRRGEASAADSVRGASLAEARIDAVLRIIAESGAQTVADLGCGSGRLLGRLLGQPELRRIVGLDVSCGALSDAARRLRLEELAPRQRARIELLHGSLTYADDRLRGLDLAALVEVIEHVDPLRLAALESAVFGRARPGVVVLTTPNAEYNAVFEGLAPGEFRHADHRFEWTRDELAGWARGVAGRNGYQVELSGIGPEEPGLGCPTQLAVFRR